MHSMMCVHACVRLRVCAWGLRGRAAFSKALQPSSSPHLPLPGRKHDMESGSTLESNMNLLLVSWAKASQMVTKAEWKNLELLDCWASPSHLGHC